MSEHMRILLLADYSHPYIYRVGFPEGLPDIDMVLAAGDVSGDYLEFVATKLPKPVVYVQGNHNNEMVREEGEYRAPAGVICAHERVIEVAGLTIAGWGGVPQYREKGSGQYTAAQGWQGFAKIAMQLETRKLLGRKPLDILLTHAPPLGPHAGSDYAHRGCPSITQLLTRYHPQVLVHGHIHEYEGKRVEYQAGKTRVINAYGYKMIEID